MREAQAEIIQPESRLRGEGRKAMGRLGDLEKRKKSKSTCSYDTY